MLIRTRRRAAAVTVAFVEAALVVAGCARPQAAPVSPPPKPACLSSALADQSVRQLTNADGTPGPIIGFDDNDPQFQKVLADYTAACGGDVPLRQTWPDGVTYLFPNGTVFASGNTARRVFNSGTLATWALYGESSAASGNPQDPYAGEARAGTVGRMPADWIGGWFTPQAAGDNVAGLTTRAEAKGAHPTLVMYAQPGADCGGDSSGAGSANETDYQKLNEAAAAPTKGHVGAVLIFAPDGLGFLTQPGGKCAVKGDAEVAKQVDQYVKAITAWKQANPQHRVFVATSSWNPASFPRQAAILKAINSKVPGGIAGFVPDVSNDTPVDTLVRNAEQLAGMTGMGYILDTSRDGAASPGYVQTPDGHAVDQPSRGIGPAPSGMARGTHQLGNLDVKQSVERDGTVPTGADDPRWADCGVTAGSVCYFLGAQLYEHAAKDHYVAPLQRAGSGFTTTSDAGVSLVLSPAG